MFGYVTAYKPELKMKDFYKYKAYYCGLCRALKERHGYLGQMTLTYDMTFLILLLTSLYEKETEREQRHCIIHPVKKHDMLHNEFTDYAADMNLVLAYHHLVDDFRDENSISGLAGAAVLRKNYKKINKTYERQCKAIRKSLHQLQLCEQRNETDIDTVARHFGDLMGELFLYRKDEWEKPLRKMGFFLGKFIYIMDAYEDLEKDKKSSGYNPLISYQKKESFEVDCNHMLTMMMAECTKEYEKLPCLFDVDILNNILYAGVWTKYDNIQEKLHQQNIGKQHTEREKE